MRNLNEVVAKLQNVEDLLLSHLQEDGFCSSYEYDEIHQIRNKVFKMIVTINDIQDYYGT